MSNKLLQLQTQISELDEDEFETLYAWFDEHQMQRWGMEGETVDGDVFGSLNSEVMSALDTLESLEITQAGFDDTLLWIGLSDGRSLGVPLSWYPSLLAATPEQREHAEIGATALVWKQLDLEISLADMLTGSRDEPVE